MNLVEDGRYNKCANIVLENTDAPSSSWRCFPIGDALVNLGQKNVLIDTQGNWGDIRTGGDKACRFKIH